MTKVSQNIQNDRNTSKIYEITKMPSKSSNSPKYSKFILKTYKIPSKMTKILCKQSKMIEIPLKFFLIAKIPLKSPKWPKYLLIYKMTKITLEPPKWSKYA